MVRPSAYANVQDPHGSSEPPRKSTITATEEKKSKYRDLSPLHIKFQHILPRLQKSAGCGVVCSVGTWEEGCVPGRGTYSWLVEDGRYTTRRYTVIYLCNVAELSGYNFTDSDFSWFLIHHHEILACLSKTYHYFAATACSDVSVRHNTRKYRALRKVPMVLCFAYKKERFFLLKCFRKY